MILEIHPTNLGAWSIPRESGDNSFSHNPIGFEKEYSGSSDLWV